MPEEHTIRDGQGELQQVSLTPGRAIRLFCVECVDGFQFIKECGGGNLLDEQAGKNGTCLFFPYRLGRGRPSVKTIRKFCLECMGDHHSFIPDCPSRYCPLYPFRMGKIPSLKGKRCFVKR